MNTNDIMEFVDLLRNRSVVAVEDRCIAVRNRNASCKRCIQACPVDAISVTQNKLTINAGSCAACGACIAVCPTSAIVGVEPLDEDLAEELVAALEKAEGHAVIACARIASHNVGDPEKYVSVPCLGRVDEPLLVALAAHGVDDIVLVDGTCSTCKYRHVSRYVDDVVESALGLLEMRGSSASITRSSEFPANILADDTRKVQAAARRSFFTETGGYARDVAVRTADRLVIERFRQSSQQDKIRSLRERLGAGKTGKMPTFESDRNMRLLNDLCEMGSLVQDELYTRLFGSVEIDTEQCSGCGMCVLFCPTAALNYAEEEYADSNEPKKAVGKTEESGPRELEFQVADCVQCMLCSDVCMKHCLDVSPVVSTEELFDFEPRTLEIPPQQKKKQLFNYGR